MKDEQFEILVALISETKESLQSQINSLRSEMKIEMKKMQKDLEFKIIEAISEVRKQLEDYEKVNRAQHGKLHGACAN